MQELEYEELTRSMNISESQPDIIIWGGTIVDGSGSAPYIADLAVKGDKIVYIGKLEGVTAPLEIDAQGKYVTPGFIDSHTHSDQTIWGNPECHSSVRQGVTTEIVGNCGLMGKTKMQGVPFDKKGDGIDCIYNLPGPVYTKGAIAATLDKMDQMGASINTAWFCGHNGLRIMAGLNTPDYTEEQFQQMDEMLREALDAGFIGLSTGLEFIPGNVSRPEEVERLVSIVAEYDANYSSHMRDEGTYIQEAVDEFLNVVRKTGVRGTISHLNVKYDNGVPNEYLQKVMNKVKEARIMEHLEVYTDMLSTCFAPGAVEALLPPWLYENGWEEARETLADPLGRQRVKEDFCRYWRFLSAGQWDRLLSLRVSYMPEITGRPFQELVKESGKDPFDFLLDVIQAAPTAQELSKLGMQGIVFNEQTLIDSVITDPIYMWMSDAFVTVEEGPLFMNTCNIQNYMTMTYFFTRYVRDLGVISIEKALEKVSSIPARHFRLEGRGMLAVGNYADINVFDINELKVNATFEQVNRYSSGMDYVIVNGIPVIEKGMHTGARAGRVLRHKR